MFDWVLRHGYTRWAGLAKRAGRFTRQPRVGRYQAFTASFLLSYILAALVIAVTIVVNRRVSNIRAAESADIEALKEEHAAKVTSLE